MGREWASSVLSPTRTMVQNGQRWTEVAFGEDTRGFSTKSRRQAS